MNFVNVVLSIIFVTLSYLTFLHLILWFENKDSLGKRIIKSKNLPTVSIIVPAYNEEKNIEKVIKNLLAVNYPKNKTEIIIVDDGSTDDTFEIARKYSSNLKVLKKRNEGKASALNFGIDHATHDYIAVIDADSFIDVNALKVCMGYFNEKDVAAVTSHILVKRKLTFWENLMNLELMIIALMRKAQEKINVVSATPGPLSVYKKDILIEVGKFNKDVLVEDVEIAWRILERGYKIKMALNAMVYSIFPDNFSNWWKQRVRWNIGGIQTLLLYFPSIFKTSYGVGKFLVPVSTIGYSLSFVGIGLFLFLFLSNLITYLLFIISSLNIGLNPFTRFEFTYLIDFRVFYGLLLFVLSIFVIRLVLDMHKEKTSLINLILFLTVYSMLFPLNMLYATYKFVKGEKEWLTK